jgi:hypothetical protein
MPHIQFGSAASNYEFPTVDGDPSQILTTDGTGQLSWADQGEGGGSSAWVDDGGLVRLVDDNDTVRVGTHNGGAVVNISDFGQSAGSYSTGLGVWTGVTGSVGSTAGYFSASGGISPVIGVQAVSSSTTADTVYAYNSLATNYGSGPAIGLFGHTDFQGTGDKIGVRGRGAGAGAGDTYGGYFQTAGGMSNTGTKYGVYAYGHNLTSTNAYGVYGEAYNPNDGMVFGGYFITSGNGTGMRLGVSAHGSADNSTDAFGVYGSASNNGSGNVCGGSFSVLSNGTGEKRGLRAAAVSLGSESTYGIDTYASGHGTGTIYGINVFATGIGSGIVNGGHIDIESNSTDPSYGLEIEADASSTGDIYGVRSTATSTSTGKPYGGKFQAYGNTHVFGLTGGAYGTDADYVRGVWGTARNLGPGPAEAGYFSADNNGTGTHYGVYAYELAGGSGAAVYAVGDFVASGTKSAVTKTSQGATLMYAVESSEVWFEDLGKGQLINGKTHIELDPLFLETVTIDNDHPINVFIQLNDDCNGTYVKTSLTGFDVFELQRGTSDASFTYRVVAKRKGYESERMRTAEVGHDDPNLYPERAEEILEKMQAPSRTE